MAIILNSMVLFYAVFFVLRVGLLSEHVAAAPTVKSAREALAYLETYGHAKKSSTAAGAAGDAAKTQVLRQSLIRFQRFARLNQTGELDNDTVTMMNMRRCAVPDNVGFSTAQVRRRRRYVLEGSIWSRTSLQYNFINYTQQMPRSQVTSIVQRAFQHWSDASILRFIQTTNSPDIRILYAKLAHGDGYPFDGPGGILAHAFFPDSGGQAHFDDDETWTDGVATGTSLVQVSTHEIGHTLGLGHSSAPGAVMQPFYPGYNANFQLGQDDVAAINVLYAPPPTTTVSPVRIAGYTPLTTTTTRPVVSAVCPNAVIDAMVVVDQTTYAFQGDQYYVLDSYGVVAGYPRPITNTWPAVGGQIDTAIYFPPAQQRDSNGNLVLTQAGQLFLFKGSIYWKYGNVSQLYPNYPRYISSGFPGIPNNLDAAFIWTPNGCVYFVQGNQYYRYTIGTGADPGYPKSMSAWGGVPSPINTAFQWTNYRTYFFVGTQYYRFNDNLIQVDTGYPKPTSVWWFGCPNPSNPGNLDGSYESVHEDNVGNEFYIAGDTGFSDWNSGTKGLPSFSLIYCYRVLALFLLYWLQHYHQTTI